MAKEYMGGTGRRGHLGPLNYTTDVIHLLISKEPETDKKFLRKIENGEFVVSRSGNSNNSLYKDFISRFSGLYHKIFC